MIGETKFIATARLEDGQLTVKVTAVTPYGTRSASVDQEVTDEKIVSRIESGLDAAVRSIRGELHERANTEAARAAVVAGDNKEAFNAK
jgi:hypothetical protein